jgi:hypothetical protein
VILSEFKVYLSLSRREPGAAVYPYRATTDVWGTIIQ